VARGAQPDRQRAHIACADDLVDVIDDAATRLTCRYGCAAADRRRPTGSVTVVMKPYDRCGDDYAVDTDQTHLAVFDAVGHDLAPA
jgi:hypothetical protein